jgi:hypothetical protein
MKSCFTAKIAKGPKEKFEGPEIGKKMLAKR